MPRTVPDVQSRYPCETSPDDARKCRMTAIAFTNHKGILNNQKRRLSAPLITVRPVPRHARKTGRDNIYPLLSFPDCFGGPIDGLRDFRLCADRLRRLGLLIMWALMPLHHSCIAFNTRSGFWPHYCTPSVCRSSAFTNISNRIIQPLVTTKLGTEIRFPD